MGVGRPVDDDDGPGSLTVRQFSLGDQWMVVARPPIVPPEAPPEGGGINLGGFHRLRVPAENIDAGSTAEDLDFSASMIATVRKPDKAEWFGIQHGLYKHTRLLPTKPAAGGMETIWYYVQTLHPGPQSGMI